MILNMPHVVFDQMHYTFKHKLNINSHYAITRQLAVLSSIELSYFDCCPKSCIAYTSDYALSHQCLLCSQTQFWKSPQQKPHWEFCYIPIIPRLQNFFANTKTIEELLYWHNYHMVPSTIPDVFDSEHYQNLRKTTVTVNGKKLAHKYFSSKYDIAFSVCLDR